MMSQIKCSKGPWIPAHLVYKIPIPLLLARCLLHFPLRERSHVLHLEPLCFVGFTVYLIDDSDQGECQVEGLGARVRGGHDGFRTSRSLFPRLFSEGRAAHHLAQVATIQYVSITGARGG